MITIISGTNRPNSRTALVSEFYSKCLKELKVEHKIFKLIDLPKKLIHDQMYDGDHMSTEMIEIQEEFILGSEKLMILTPEYNGSFPGIFKLFVDALCARKYKENFSGKKICLTGVANGRAGNLRGMESMTGFFNYLGGNVFPQKLPISSIEQMLNEDSLVNEDIKAAIKEQINGFLAF